MYVIKDKTNNETLFISYTERDANLKPEDLFPGFDPVKMEFGWCGPQGIPEHYKIDPGGRIIELTLEEKVIAGIIKLDPTQKLENNNIVEKSLVQQVKEGLITMPPGRKLSGEGDHLTLVDKTLAEQVEDGTVQLEPGQKVEGDGIVEKDLREQFDDGLIALEEYKQAQIEYFSGLAFDQRQSFLPDYKLQNAALGLYPDAEKAAIKATVQAFKDEFKRLRELVKKAPDADAIAAITPNYPGEFVK